MNLLNEKDKWIPVRKGTRFYQMSYKELLCTEQPDLQVALPRDDLELACIQMLAALTQVIFMPENKKELRARIRTPLSEQEYDQGIKKFMDWFDLDHPKWPFMQVLDPGTDDPTPIQKLFPGLPAGNNHAFFNGKDEYEKVCPSCASIGLFNLCTHTPNLSGKHKGGLRGNAPISTMIYDVDFRRMVWINVLTKETADRIFVGERSSYPVWIEPIKSVNKVPAISIGITRGLFWAPIHVRLQLRQELIRCDCCGMISNTGVHGFLLGSEFKFDVVGLWPHPYSPRQLNLQKENRKGKEKPEESIVSFKTTDPAWTQFSELLFQSDKTEKKDGFIPAAVVSQFHDLFSDQAIHLLIGGYRNKQAAILQRRHELYTIPAGWNDDKRDRIIEIIEIGLKAKKVLTDKVLYPVVKGAENNGEKGVGAPINSKASSIFFHLTEPLIHSMLGESSLREFVQAKNVFLEDLSRICFDIFERVTRPYAHKPEVIGTIALARNKLNGLLSKLKFEHTFSGGLA
jgi:CRISPR system Cascade subunit CasA